MHKIIGFKNNTIDFIRRNHRAIIATAFVFTFALSQIIPLPLPPYSENKNVLDSNQIFVVGETTPYVRSILDIENKNSIVIKSIPEGYVGKINIKIGEKVKKGDSLFEITQGLGENKSLETEIKIRENLLREAEAKLDFLDSISKTTDDISQEKIKDFNELIEIKEDVLDELDAQIIQIQELLKDLSTLSTSKTDFETRTLILDYTDLLNKIKFQRDLYEYETSSKYPLEKVVQFEGKIDSEVAENQVKLARIDMGTKKLELDLLKTQKELRTIKSPIDGVIQKIMPKMGDTVISDQELAIVAGKIDLMLTAKILPQLAPLVDVSKNAFLYSDQNKFELSIEFVSTVEIENGLHEVTFDSKNDEELLSIDEPKISIPLLNDKLIVPVDSIHQTEWEKYVYVDESGIAKKRVVKTGEIFDSFVVLSEGIESGTRIILDREISEGSTLEIRNESNSE